VKSDSKWIKESAMNSRFKDRFEEDLVNIESSLHKKSGVKQLDKVHERIGRLNRNKKSVVLKTELFSLVLVQSKEVIRV
jgi:hypothetical protein